MSYYRAPAEFRKTEVTEYDETILGKMVDFLLQLIAQLTFEGCSSARARGERQSNVLRLSCFDGSHLCTGAPSRRPRREPCDLSCSAMIRPEG
jgi:hypothetical protein